MSGLFYLAGALLLGGGFHYYAVPLMKGDDESIAMKTFGYSIWYLMAMFTISQYSRRIVLGLASDTTLEDVRHDPAHYQRFPAATQH
jgi:hypothetical protein